MKEADLRELQWRAEASRMLKSQLARYGISYAELVNRLNADGASESYASIANKVSRGSFSFAFYLQCIHALQAPLQERGLDVVAVRKRNLK